MFKLIFNLNYLSLFNCVIIFFVLLNNLVKCFNVDTSTVIVHRGNPETYYGFSVALHKEGNKDWLLVGAPLSIGKQEGIAHGGAVFKCIPTLEGSCQMIPFDTLGNGNITSKSGTMIPVEEKDKQWFGATVQSSGSTGIIVACAPRYVYFSYNQNRREPVGSCYISRGSFSGFIPVQPCRKDEKWGYHRLGSCQAGFSAAISETGRWLFVGAVGSVYWQGKVFSWDMHQFQNEPFESKDGSESDDNSYMGYSLTLGKFSNSNEVDVAVGMPRGWNLLGQVLIFTRSLNNVFNITGDVMGSYFGYSLATVDVNNDGLEDIIIGAPLYSKPEAKDKSYEHGRVYVSYQRRRGVFELVDKIDGIRHRSRFGTSVTSLGDINLDGFEDFAVGAPYDGEDGRGAIYIFNGGKNGVNTNYSQVIFATDLHDPGLKTFGFSLSGGLDMDSNQYSDLLVGAYLSDRAVYLRSRPVVNVNATLEISPSKISLEQQNCNLQDGTKVSCVSAELCLSFDGINIPERMNFTNHIKIDASTNRAPRAFLLKYQNENDRRIPESLYKLNKKCERFYIYLSNNIRDKLTPIEIDMEYNLMDYFPSRSTIVKPILNKAVNNRLVRQVTIQKNCSSDVFCVPDLILSIKPNMNQYLIGTGDDIELNVTIYNKGEDAFESMFELEIPPDVQYTHTEGIKGCYPPKPEVTGKNLLQCDIGNPMSAKTKSNFVIHLKPKTIVDHAASTFLFLANVSSSNNETKTTFSDNYAQLSIPVRVEVDLTTSGASNPEQIIHNITESLSTVASADDWGYAVNHVYTVRNLGPSSITLTKVTILWPIRTLDDQFLMYLLTDPIIDITQGEDRSPIEANCERIDSELIDPLRLPLDFDYDYNRNGYYATNGSYIRKKRSTSSTNGHFNIFEDSASCGATKCTKINCTIKNFGKQSVTFSIKSRLSKQALVKIGMPEFEVTSKLIAEIIELPYGIKNTYIPPKTSRVATDIHVLGLDKSFPIPLWVILLAILIGLLLLALLACLLWKCGFFKRKRPPTKTDDYEPLQPNSNGYKYRKGDTSL